MRSTSRMPARRNGIAGLAIAMVVAMSCNSNPVGNNFGSNPDGVLVQVSIVEVSGNRQVVPSGGAESDSLVVRVVNQDDSPIPGLAVDWEVVQGEGTLSAASSAADADGYARATYISGDTPGDTEITATLSIASSGAFAGRDVPPVSFELTVSP